MQASKQQPRKYFNNWDSLQMKTTKEFINNNTLKWSWFKKNIYWRYLCLVPHSRVPKIGPDLSRANAKIIPNFKGVLGPVSSLQLNPSVGTHHNLFCHSCQTIVSGKTYFREDTRIPVLPYALKRTQTSGANLSTNFLFSLIFMLHHASNIFLWNICLGGNRHCF